LLMLSLSIVPHHKGTRKLFRSKNILENVFLDYKHYNYKKQNMIYMINQV